MSRPRRPRRVDPNDPGDRWVPGILAATVALAVLFDGHLIHYLIGG